MDSNPKLKSKNVFFGQFVPDFLTWGKMPKKKFLGYLTALQITLSFIQFSTFSYQ